MSAAYGARMEVLQRKREELTAQRQAIEKRVALREATAAEFSAVALQSCKHKWKAQRSAAVVAKKRNDEFVRALHEAQKQAHDTWSKLRSEQASSSALLAQEKARYNRRVEQVYPAWQEQLQKQRVQKLRGLEDKKRAVERRRYLAKKSFEKEQTLGDLIRKTRHEVEMAENLEQNEVYERELLRTQSTNQAKEVGQSIREVAIEARSYLQQQAAKQLEVAPDLGEELAERLSETFSPRNTLRALREGSSSLAFDENQQYEEEKPARQIRVQIPARMNSPTRSYYPEVSQRDPYPGYPVDEAFEDDYADEISRGFNKRPAFFKSATPDRYQTSTNAGNEHINFKQAIDRDLPTMVSRDQLPRTATSNLPPVSEHIISQRAPYAEVPRMEQHSANPSIGHVHHTTREEPIAQPRDRMESFPTLVTGQLYPIPEVNEPISSAGTSPVVPGKANVHAYETIGIPGRENGSPSTIANFTAPFSTAMNSRISLPEPPASTHPEKIEENRVARPPAAPVAVATPIGDTLHARVDEDRPVEHQGNAVAPEPSNKRTISRKPPAISIPEPIESYVLSSSITETTAEGPAGVPLQDDLPEDEADPLDEKTTGDEGRYFSLSVDSVSTPSQLDAPSNTIAPSIAAAEDLLRTEVIAAEEIDTNKHIVDIEVVPRTFLTNDTIEVQQPERSLYQESTSKIASFHDMNPVRESINANLSVTLTSTLDAVDISVEIREDANEKNLAELPESPLPSISYGTDLLEPFSLAPSSPVNAQSAEDDMMLSSMQSDDFDLPASSVKPTAETKPTVPSANDAPMQNDDNAVETSAARHASSPEPPSSAPEEVNIASITEKLSPVDRVKALRALISRVEEGAMEGDTLGGSTDTGSTNDSKRELLKMAVGGRQAQIAFFGSDICFELILDISRDLGPVLFPQKAFEGIMNDQKIRKLHQSNKEKQLDLWKALSGYLKQLVQLKAIPAATLVDLFVTAFLDHDPDNQRSQRKLRDFLVSVCGSGGSKTSSPRKEAPTPSPPPSPPKQGQRTASPEPAKPEDRVGTPQLLQTAFLQRQSPPKPKVFGIASSSFKGRSSGSSDVLMSMSSGPMKLSQKLMRGGKMNDYSEFEEEEEVDLQNLIGTKPTFASGTSVLGRSRQAAKTSPKGRAATTQAALEEEEDEFDADF